MDRIGSTRTRLTGRWRGALIALVSVAAAAVGAVVLVGEDLRDAIPGALALDIGSISTTLTIANDKAPALSTETGELAAIQDASGRVQLFARGQDNKVWHHWWSSTLNVWKWTEITGTGPLVSSAPAAYTVGGNVTFVFVRGADNAIWYRQQSYGTWREWKSLGGSWGSGPAVTFHRTSSTSASIPLIAGYFWIFVRGADGTLGFASLSVDEAYFSRWGVVPDRTVTGSPAAFSEADEVTVFARGTDNNVYMQRYRDGIGWSSSWKQIRGPVAASSPTLGSYTYRAADGTYITGIEVYARGSDGAVWFTRAQTGGSLTVQVQPYDRNWEPWASLGGSFAAGPGTVTKDGGTGGPWTYARALDGRILLRKWNTTAWEQAP